MKTKVLVAMSGGVDSSVAALLMKKKGFDVVGVFMKNYSDSKNDSGECSWKDERKMAMKIASLLEIPLITLDFEKQYKKQVIEKMFRDYRKGITPNPDVVCNEKIKFPLLIKAMKKFNAKYLVTGHYARIKKEFVKRNHEDKIPPNIRIKSKKGLYVNYSNPREVLSEGKLQAGNSERSKASFHLLRATDEMKDQSYFLYRLKQDELKYLKFPIGDFTKKQVREIARKNNFPNFDKKSTVGICFVGKINLKDFLKKKIKPKKGKILSPDGKVIGEHDGIYYYTIGQRLGSRYGIEISKNSDDRRLMKRWYVARKDAKTNTIIAAPENHPLLFRKEIFIKNPSWINADFALNLKKVSRGAGEQFRESGFWNPKRAGLRVGRGDGGGIKERTINVLARIRQVGELLPCKIEFKNKNIRLNSLRAGGGGCGGGKIKVILKKPITGISEGQAIVLYKGKEVLGGGEITF